MQRKRRASTNMCEQLQLASSLSGLEKITDTAYDSSTHHNKYQSL